METNIKIFSSEQFGQIRTTIDERGEPRFCLSDICNALGLQSRHVRERLSDDAVSTDTVFDTLGRRQQVNFVGEDGLYDVVLDSRKPIARKFRKWVTSEVLPAIRRDGGYMVSRQGESEEELMARAIMIAQETIKRKQERIRTLEIQSAEQAAQLIATNETISAMSAEIVTLKEKTSYLDRILASKETVTITQIAQDYGMSAKAFNRKLRELGIQRKVNGQWILLAPYIKEGYVHSETITITHSDGRTGSVLHTKWRQSGRLFLYNMLKGEGILPMIER